MPKYSSATHAPAVDTAAVATITNGRNFIVEAENVWFSYDAVPTAGTLTIKSGSTTIFGPHYVTDKGPGFLPLKGIKSAKNEDLSATLSTGGGAVKGSVTLAVRI